MMITWRDVVSALALLASGVTLGLRISDRLERNRRARRNRELIEADPVDPLQHGTGDQDDDQGPDEQGPDEQGPDGQGGEATRRD